MVNSSPRISEIYLGARGAQTFARGKTRRGVNRSHEASYLIVSLSAGDEREWCVALRSKRSDRSCHRRTRAQDRPHRYRALIVRDCLLDWPSTSLRAGLFPDFREIAEFASCSRDSASPKNGDPFADSRKGHRFHFRFQREVTRRSRDNPASNPIVVFNSAVSHAPIPENDSGKTKGAFMNDTAAECDT